MPLASMVVLTGFGRVYLGGYSNFQVESAREQHLVAQLRLPSPRRALMIQALEREAELRRLAALN